MRQTAARDRRGSSRDRVGDPLEEIMRGEIARIELQGLVEFARAVSVSRAL